MSMKKIILAFSYFIIFSISAGGAYSQSWEFRNDYSEYGTASFICAAYNEVTDQDGRPKGLAFAFHETTKKFRIFGDSLRPHLMSKISKASLEISVDKSQPITFTWMNETDSSYNEPDFSFSYGNEKGAALLEEIAKGSRFIIRYKQQYSLVTYDTEQTSTQVFEGELSGSRKAITALDNCAKQYLPRQMVCGPKPTLAKLQLNSHWNGKAPADMAGLSKSMGSYRNNCQDIEAFFKKWKHGYEGCLRDRRISDRECDKVMDMRNACRHDLRYVIGFYEEKFTRWAQCTKGN